jgi:anti-anti-sigma factor
MKLADLHFESRDRIVIATLDGEVDMSNAQQLNAALAEATPNEALGLVVDLSAVEYLDSAGIHLIYTLSVSLRARGQAIALVVPDGSPVSAALRFAGIRQQLPVFASAHEATRELAGGAAA